MLLSLLLIASLTTCTGNDDIASLFYPPGLATAATAVRGVVPDRSWACQEADLDASGKPDYVVVAYTNGQLGQVRVLRKTAGGATVAADALTPSVYGNHPRVQLVDLDGNGKPEIVVSYATGKSHRQFWTYRWNNGALDSLNPPGAGEDGSFVDANLADIYGNGKIAILEPTEDYGETDASGGVIRTFDVYVLGNSKYEEAATSLAYFSKVKRAKGEPRTITDTFSATPGSYVLEITTAPTPAEPVVDSAIITVNGKTVAGPSEFNGKVRHFAIPVTLATTNTIAVEVRSAPGTELSVAVTKQQ